MELNFLLLCRILGAAGFLALAGWKACQQQRAHEDERRRRTVDNLRAALLG